MVRGAKRVVASAPAKINLALRVGALGADGFHPVLTAFQALDIWETLTVEASDESHLIVRSPWGADIVPTGPENTVWKAAKVMGQRAGIEPLLSINLDKRIPVAGGMAGGSADAAATLLALNALWGVGLETPELLELAAQVGSDVAFCVVGGSAIGRGRGEILEPLTVSQTLHWVVLPQPFPLSTPEVYRRFDQLHPSAQLPDSLDPEFLGAWVRGDATALAPLLTNDLQGAACDLEPSLDWVLERVRGAGALASVVSGSGPTVLGLAGSEGHARELASRLEAEGLSVMVTCSTEQGSTIHSP